MNLNNNFSAENELSETMWHLKGLIRTVGGLENCRLTTVTGCIETVLHGREERVRDDWWEKRVKGKKCELLSDYSQALVYLLLYTLIHEKKYIHARLLRQMSIVQVLNCNVQGCMCISKYFTYEYTIHRERIYGQSQCV